MFSTELWMNTKLIFIITPTYLGSHEFVVKSVFQMRPLKAEEVKCTEGEVPGSGGLQGGTQSAETNMPQCRRLSLLVCLFCLLLAANTMNYSIALSGYCTAKVG